MADPPKNHEQPGWPTCRIIAGCIGIRVGDHDGCLRHLTGYELEDALKQRESALDVRGTQIDAELLAAILRTMLDPMDDRPRPGGARFDRATFTDDAFFRGAYFASGASFRQAHFSGDAVFRGARFAGGTSFRGVHFARDATFDGAQFIEGGDASFREVHFGGNTSFDEVRFARSVVFSGANFVGRASFDTVEFGQGAVYNGAQFIDAALFGKAVFNEEASFQEVEFLDEALFAGTCFRSSAIFRGVLFDGPVLFEEAQFDGEASFQWATFDHCASFEGAHFSGESIFGGLQFLRDVRFDGAQFDGSAGFERANFQACAGFDEASFHGDARFDQASFHGDARFDQASFHGDARFDQASFQQPIDLGPLAVARTLVLDGIESDQPVQLEVAARRLSCKRTRFRAGGHLRIAWAEISLEDAEIPAPLMVVRHPPDQELSKLVGWLAEPDGQASGFPPPLPTLVSVQRADVAGLVLADIDLRDCHFTGAHHLDQLQLTTADAFHRAPGLLPGRRRSRGRKVLAEECRWRQTRGGWRGRRWRHTTSELFCSPLLEGARQPGRTELAVVYRRLRKGREDAKNEPGAADFYYGEMEMRRHNANTPRAERHILHLYWLASGYGLRGLRALGLLLAFVLLAAAAIHKYGYTGAEQSWSRTFVYAAGAATRLVTPANEVLNDTGQAIRIAMGLLGPLLLGLAVLAVRNRVKR